MKFDDGVAETLGDGNEYLLRLVAFLMLVRRELLEARNPRLALRLTPSCALPHPFELFLHRLDARDFLLGFGREALFFLLEPRRVIPLPRDAVATIELENPFRRVVEKVAIVRDGHHRAGKLLQELLQPIDAFGIEVVRRFIEQQHVGLREQQPA